MAIFSAKVDFLEQHFHLISREGADAVENCSAFLHYFFDEVCKYCKVFIVRPGRSRLLEFEKRHWSFDRDFFQTSRLKVRQSHTFFFKPSILQKKE